jgi:HNH endonuclease
MLRKTVQVTLALEKKLCECGCGLSRPAADNRGRPRRFIKGHGNKFKPGSENPKWTSGRYNDSKGYAMVQCLGHPKANVHGYVYEHILVIEGYLSRHLNPDIEVVHHIDGNKQNNDISNLQIMTRGEHTQYHAKLRKRNKFGQLIQKLEHIL